MNEDRRQMAEEKKEGLRFLIHGGEIFSSGLPSAFLEKISNL